MDSNCENNILLILDLDETLIHATKDPLDTEPDFQYADYFVYLRPNLSPFLKTVNEKFKLAIWSSADDKYVEDIISRIKPSEIEFQFIWGRSRCTYRRDYDLDEYVYEKRLKKVKKQGFKLEQILIIDDSPNKTRDNYGNAIYVHPFEGDSKDNELLVLMEFLALIQDSANVRNVEKRGWRNKVT
ncbi:HAD family hydrolase [Fulvivirgaceae bacterium BMA12]|uniref:HAD family hydrolase n=1 Tax=Agaribacillus aureus TaxID=3051825 RepID=A0ABT8L2E1_9BACT|nr:HAD family hydrolase [Fulvivirgaceae bacterium BMA12]